MSKKPEVEASINTPIPKKIAGVLALVFIIAGAIAAMFGVVIESDVDEEGVEISVDLPDREGEEEGSAEGSE